jgi:hypothetical protein
VLRAGRVTGHFGGQQLLGVTLPTQREPVQALHLGVGPDVLGGVAAAVVAPIDLVRRGRAGRHGH